VKHDDHVNENGVEFEKRARSKLFQWRSRACNEGTWVPCLTTTVRSSSNIGVVSSTLFDFVSALPYNHRGVQLTTMRAPNALTLGALGVLARRAGGARWLWCRDRAVGAWGGREIRRTGDQGESSQATPRALPNVYGRVRLGWD